MNYISSSNASQVQGTNDNSIVSKLSMVNAGYYKDEFLHNFVKKPQKRCSLINRGYYIRTKIVQYVVQKFIADNCEGKKQIISLGAGYDTTYFQSRLLSKSDDSFLFIEIDFPEVIKNKICLAKSNGLLGESNKIELNDVSIFSCQNYIAIGYDLRNVGKNLTNALQEIGVSLEDPTLWFSEVVLTYLTGSQSSRVLKWIGHTFPNAMTLIFEQMLPHDSFGLVMCRHFVKLGSPLSSIHSFPTLDSHIKRHAGLGFSRCTFTDLFSFFNRLPISEQLRINKLELFDEYEGWHQMCLHYFALCSTNSQSSHLRRLCTEMFHMNSLDSFKEPQLKVEIANLRKIDIPLQVFGHSSSVYEDGQKLLVFGGFGIPLVKKNNKLLSHQRLRFISILNLNDAAVECSFPLEFKETLFSSCVTHTIAGQTVFIIFGGRAAPNCPSNRLLILKFAEEKPQIEVVNSGERKPPARWRHTSTMIINDDNVASVMIIGGRDESCVFNDCWRLDLDTMSWSFVTLNSLSSHDFQPRHSHSTCYWKGRGKLVVSGGMNSMSEPSSDILLLDSNGDFECLKISPPPFPRHSHTSHIVHNHFLLLVGGVFFPTSSQLVTSPSSVQDHIAVINLNTSTWIRRIHIPSSYLDHPVRPLGHTSIVRKDEDDKLELILFGGGANCFSFGTSFTMSPLVIELKI